MVSKPGAIRMLFRVQCAVTTRMLHYTQADAVIANTCCSPLCCQNGHVAAVSRCDLHFTQSPLSLDPPSPPGSAADSTCMAAPSPSKSWTVGCATKSCSGMTRGLSYGSRSSASAQDKSFTLYLNAHRHRGTCWTHGAHILGHRAWQAAHHW